MVQSTQAYDLLAFSAPGTKVALVHVLGASRVAFPWVQIAAAQPRRPQGQERSRGERQRGSPLQGQGKLSKG